MSNSEEYSIILTETPEEAPKKFKLEKPTLFETFGAAVAAIIAVTLIFTFLFRIVSVDGTSMKPVLQNGNRVVISALGCKPERGDIVVFSTTGTHKKANVKRDVPLAGDVVDINFTTGVVTVNGEEEEYTDNLTLQQFDIAFPVTVPEGTVFVLGDNRGNSLDSRSTQIGFVDERMIVGKVLFKLVPPGRVE